MKVAYWKREEAIDFLLEALADGEKPSADVTRWAADAGINKTTLTRARKELQVKSRRGTRGKGWFASIPDIEEKTKTRDSRRTKSEHKHQMVKEANYGQISRDWVAVTTLEANSIENRPKIDIPSCKIKPGELRVKVGAYEFEADENFPFDKLAELLRGLGVGDLC